MRSRWRATLGLILLTSVVAIQPATAQDNLPSGRPAAGQPTFEQNVSYVIGLYMGRDLMQKQVPVDPKSLIAGIQDALSKAKPRMTDEQARDVMTQFEQLMNEKAQAQMANEATQNKEEGAAFLTENGKKDGVKTTDSGLQYRVLEEGEGASPTASSTVSCHYEGTLIDGTVFDSSYKRGEPAQFPVNGVISGWTEMLQMMKEGGKVEVFIPSNLAYGDRGAPPVIGPGATLVFKIELLKVLN
ncbi:Peptidyl-prolyl cis-trans isomerase Mip precursor [Posidoniimonas polymericola]|uniref:Peptidyl-prolyl cis-trans isomerase n=1 Tax=Posidoniimonas polymericola TaxID=2528002 RepID=A0A5C5YHS2_9BACT|nr:FKBP-type peptidyl-prolyl cis-trans isomerase [Posidoniimonas polymericola]TWT74485.1 Peptidyl-prolyl cis-trans isomerase Mip precursor [Posidoniimonas polymericola]